MVGLNFAMNHRESAMSYAGEKPQLNWRSPFDGWETDRSLREAEQRPPRLDFHQASSHLTQKGPGYYLILLRNEIKHRSLRGKPGLLP